MKTHFEILKSTRQNILSSISDLTLEQLNYIPEGFNNNIAWNLGHCLLTQRLLHYGLCNLTHDTPDHINKLFRKGASPSIPIDQDTIDYFKNEFIGAVDQLEQDYNNKLFKNFKVYPTSYGYDLTSLENAIIFNNTHEALHFGYIMALKRALK